GITTPTTRGPASSPRSLTSPFHPPAQDERGSVTAWYDPPQPGKGILIGLGFTVTVITAASGYFKPRERAFNLQQTADSIEQHTTALELGISPYDATDERGNLTQYATVIEGLRADQRMREQQLDQPQQGQQQVI
ncbi:hypothetical protein, partial [Streptomyces sp. NPDC005009]